MLGSGQNHQRPQQTGAPRVHRNRRGGSGRPAIARWLVDAALREEAIYCLERIPGEASDRALTTAYAAAGSSPAFPAAGVRHAERLVKSAPAQALAIYRTLLDRNEEHLQCAAVVGLARIGTAEAAVLVLPKTKSTRRNGRIAAQRAWKSMAG